MLIPIGTNIQLHRRPIGNYVLVALNVLVYLAVNRAQIPLVELALPPLNGAVPSVFEYVSYQFRHGDFWHLAGNMLFLWIFGNAVCARMGSIPYIVFYVAGGIFAAWIYALGNDNPLVGASGSIAAVTTAFLVLFPKTHITLLFWLVIVTTIQLPAMLFIVVKIILWDNVIAYTLDPNSMAQSVAYEAHLGGYGFGFAVALFLLATRALPRDNFDLFSIWDRKRRKREMGPMFSPRDVPLGRPIEEPRAQSEADKLRERLMEFAYDQDWERAAELHRELLAIDAEHVLPQPQQRQLATWYYQSQRFDDAVQAYEQFLTAYPGAPDAGQIRLLCGMIYRSYLNRPAPAVKHLERAVDELVAPQQRTLAEQELSHARAALYADREPT